MLILVLPKSLQVEYSVSYIISFKEECDFHLKKDKHTDLILPLDYLHEDIQNQKWCFQKFYPINQELSEPCSNNWICELSDFQKSYFQETRCGLARTKGVIFNLRIKNIIFFHFLCLLFVCFLLSQH